MRSASHVINQNKQRASTAQDYFAERALEKEKKEEEEGSNFKSERSEQKSIKARSNSHERGTEMMMRSACHDCLLICLKCFLKY
jgi:actin-related protein